MSNALASFGVCEQEISCCPPDPWSYLIHEAYVTVSNTQQCATVSCPDGSHLITECVAPGTYTATGDPANQIALQYSVDAKAAQQALQQANDALNAASPCVTPCQYWCAISTCVQITNPDGSLGYNIDTNYTNDPNTPCVAPANGYASSVPAGKYTGTSQTDADQKAKDALYADMLANLHCNFYCKEVWAIADCNTQTVEANCVYSDPGIIAGKVTGHVAAADPACNSAVSQSDADAKACAKAKQIAAGNLNTCNFAAKLTGLLWQMPCVKPTDPAAVRSCLGSTPPHYYDTDTYCTCCDPADQVVTLTGGNAGQEYLFTVKIRGCVELKDYTGGAIISGTNNYCVLNGTPGPTYAGSANQYTLEVSDPPQTFYLNNLFGNIPQGNIYRLDGDSNAGTGTGYQFTFRIKPGATVTLKTRSLDKFEYRANYFNWQRVVPDDDPQHPIQVDQNLTATDQGYSGQWVQMDVMGYS